MGATVTMVESDGTRTELAEFALEAEAPGEVPQRVIDELCESKRIAQDYAQAFSDAAKAQAEKYKVNAAALKRYVNAIVGDKVETLEVENEHLERLLAKG